MFQFISLLGAQTDKRASASLLLFDNGIKVLVDCGWSKPFNVKDLAEIERHTPTISVILLTHPTLSHLGAYAHCCAHIPLFSQIPVYCTYPVANLGRTLLQDIYLAHPLIHAFVPSDDFDSPKVLLTPPTSEDIDRYFDAVHSLKYSQPFQFPAPLTGLTITAYRAGHTLGGTIWRIQHLQENVLYSVDWNHSRDAHLSSAAFLPGGGGVPEEFLKPTAMICSTRNALPDTQTIPRRRRDELLLETVRKVAFGGGTVLIPTDSSARVLELSYLLEHDYRKKDSGWQSSNTSILLACRTAGRTLRFVRSSLEWMDESMVREFEATDAGAGRDDKSTHGPFDLKHLKVVEKPKQLNRLLNVRGGKVIIASDNSMEWGFSRDVLVKIAENENNLIVLTERMESASDEIGTLLYKSWKDQQGANDSMGSIIHLDGSDWDIPTVTRTNLTPSEFASHQSSILIAQNHLTTVLPGQTAVEDTQPTSDSESESSDESSDDEEGVDHKQGKALVSTVNPLRKLLTGEEMGVTILLKSKNVYDFDVRNAKGRNRMFPYQPVRRKGDEYGEVVRAEDYMRADEKLNEGEGESVGAKLELFGGNDSREYGKKRKWDANNASSPTTRRNSLAAGGAGTSNKRQRTDRAASSESASDSEPEDLPSSTTPCKLVKKAQNFAITCAVTYIDFSGLHDSRSLRMLLPLLQPRKLILVGGSARETESLAGDIRSMDSELFMPIVGRTINASVDTEAWSLKLSDKLAKSLKWQTVRGISVVHVVGRISTLTPPPDAKPTIEDVPIKEEEAVTKPQTLMLDLLPPSLSAATRTTAAPIHVGDIRLTDLRRLLLDSGHTAEFRGEGTLLCDGVVSVRKEGVGRITVEDVGNSWAQGGFGSVRKRVYEGLAVVSGGA